MTKTSELPESKESQEIKETKSPKRLILIATNKGGVGKSTTAIHIGDYLQSQNVSFVAFDPDHANASFARFFTPKNGRDGSPVRLITTTDDASLDQITKALDEEGASVVLVDGVGAQQGAFLDWIEEIDLFGRKAEMNLKITFVILIDEDKDTVDQARAVAGRAGEDVDYLVVKNLKNSPETTIYDSSAARGLLMEVLNAKEITFPKLKPNLVAITQRESLRLSEAAESPEVYVNDRCRFASYKAKIFKELEKVSDLLGAS